MRYQGGKSRTAKKIAQRINELSSPEKLYIEPFLGGAWSMCAMDRPLRIGSDNFEPIVEMWREVRDGWQPPPVTEELYDEIRANQDAYPLELVAFAGVGCSFGGKWWGGYARNYSGAGKDVDFSGAPRRSVLKKAPLLQNVTIHHADYTFYNGVQDATIYCDPPYAGTLKYASDFDHETFWNTIREWSKRNDVFVSEYVAPADFVNVLEIETYTSMSNTHIEGQKRTEKLFVHESNVKV